MSTGGNAPHGFRPGPLYWDGRCLTCDGPESAHPSLLVRIVAWFRTPRYRAWTCSLCGVHATGGPWTAARWVEWCRLHGGCRG